MNNEMLCTWLGLAKSAWPPDPWTLLGLEREQADLPTIENRVQDRMTTLRHYQLSYPEEATEGMNRLAEAFVTLTEACSKKSAAKPANGAVVSKDETSILNNTKLDWRVEPPPVRKEMESAPELILEDASAPDDVPISQPFAAPAKPQRKPIDLNLARELAQQSYEAISNVGTIEAVIERVETTRRLLCAWERLGRHLKVTTKKSPPKECDQFAKRLQAIADIMRSYPAFLGHPGKPGYRVVVQARLKVPLLTVRAMTPDQHDELVFDWHDGYQVLLLHRKHLRKLFKSMRHRTTAGLILYAARSALNDYPKLTLLGMALVAVGVIAAVLLIWSR